MANRSPTQSHVPKKVTIKYTPLGGREKTIYVNQKDKILDQFANDIYEQDYVRLGNEKGHNRSSFFYLNNGQGMESYHYYKDRKDYEKLITALEAIEQVPNVKEKTLRLILAPGIEIPAYFYLTLLVYRDQKIKIEIYNQTPYQHEFYFPIRKDDECIHHDFDHSVKYTVDSIITSFLFPDSPPFVDTCDLKNDSNAILEYCKNLLQDLHDSTIKKTVVSCFEFLASRQRDPKVVRFEHVTPAKNEINPNDLILEVLCRPDSQSHSLIDDIKYTPQLIMGRNDLKKLFGKEEMDEASPLLLETLPIYQKPAKETPKNFFYFLSTCSPGYRLQLVEHLTHLAIARAGYKDYLPITEELKKKELEYFYPRLKETTAEKLQVDETIPLLSVRSFFGKTYSRYSTHYLPTDIELQYLYASGHSTQDGAHALLRKTPRTPEAEILLNAYEYPITDFQKLTRICNLTLVIHNSVWYKYHFKNPLPKDWGGREAGYHVCQPEDLTYLKKILDVIKEIANLTLDVSEGYEKIKDHLKEANEKNYIFTYRHPRTQAFYRIALEIFNSSLVSFVNHQGYQMLGKSL